MSLSLGIIGLPNVGKSTLFNALLQKQQALAANYPFATIEPNVGIVPINDDNLQKLADTVGSKKIVPATVEFVDIAGLVRGAATGAGLGNKFLSHIRQVNAVVHVVRDFVDEDIVREGSVDPINDYQVIRTELQLADLAILQKQRAPKVGEEAEAFSRWSIIFMWRTILDDNLDIGLPPDEIADQVAKELGLITTKPEIVVLNIAEEDLGQAEEKKSDFAKQIRVEPNSVLPLAVQLEASLAGLDNNERSEYLSLSGLNQTGLERLIKTGFETLDLQVFYTAGEKEVRAWTIKRGATALDAAGTIHTDFRRGFIRANIANLEDFIALGGWKGVKEAGKLRQEGKEYLMKPTDVVEFLISL